MMQKNTTYKHISFPFKGVIFDLDDTLYPQQQFVQSGLMAVSAYLYNIYGIKVYDELLKRYLGGDRTTVFESVLKKSFKEVENSLLCKLVHVFYSHKPNISLYSDAQICMALLIAHKIKIGIITDGYAATQRRKVAALELDPLIDGVVYLDELLKAPCNPQEDAFHILTAQMGLDIDEVIFVADNPLTDFLVPRRSKIYCVRIKRNNGEYAYAEPPSPEYAPDVTISTLELISGLNPVLPDQKKKKEFFQ
jgi:putative hydrolase of the HAD superfamily